MNIRRITTEFPLCDRLMEKGAARALASNPRGWTEAT